MQFLLAWNDALAEPKPHEETCLIVGMLSAFTTLFDRAVRAMARRFGEVSRESEIFPFDSFTNYYAPQMGQGVQRKFVAFARPFDPQQLAETKLWTNALEAQFAGPEFPVPRPLNLDPGYVAPSKLVLATTKDYAHRIYLGRGIYAEVTLTFAGGRFRPNPWTYPDYQTEPYRRFFEAVRAGLLGRIEAS